MLNFPTLANGRGRSASRRGYESWQQHRFVHIHLKDKFLDNNSLEVEMHTGIPWATGVMPI